MDLKKIIYSRCPNCKQNGIKAFHKLIGNHTRKITCSYCNKVYKINPVLSVFARLAIALGGGSAAYILKQNGIDIPLWVLAIIVVFLLALFEYFSPLEEQDSLPE